MHPIIKMENKQRVARNSRVGLAHLFHIYESGSWTLSMSQTWKYTTCKIILYTACSESVHFLLRLAPSSSNLFSLYSSHAFWSSRYRVDTTDRVGYKNDRLVNSAVSVVRQLLFSHILFKNHEGTKLQISWWRQNSTWSLLDYHLGLLRRRSFCLRISCC